MSAEQSNQCVFVYGTLKRGHCRHHSISDQKFLGEATTKPQYRLFDLGDYPGMIVDLEGVSISGELYSVDHACLGRLDAIEGVDQGLYSRQSVELLPPWHDRNAVTYIYEQSISGHQEIPGWPFSIENQNKT